MINGRLYHIGLVVANVDDAVAHYGHLLGIERFARLDTEYPARFGEWSGTIENRNAFAPFGDIYLELVEPGTGQSPAKRWLEERGEGVFHLGFATADPTQHADGADAVFEVLNRLRPDGQANIAYLDTVAALGYYTELVDSEGADRLCEWVDAVAAGDDTPRELR
jgi:methylmalonyl-CoA/ethylmalonyl-CoA epimerase